MYFTPQKSRAVSLSHSISEVGQKFRFGFKLWCQGSFALLRCFLWQIFNWSETAAQKLFSWGGFYADFSMFTLMVFANFSWYIIGELFNPIANDSQTIEWTLNNIYPHCIGWAKQSTITIRASHMQLFWIFILFRAVNTVKLNFNAGLFSSTFLFEHLLLAKSHLQFTWLALITISCIFLVVGPSSLSVAIFIQLGLSSNWMKGNDSLHYPSFNLRIPRQCQQNFEVNFILREWSSWMMERHFPFPYAAPQIYASPGCNAENSNFNMTERNLISRKFFFPFFCCWTIQYENLQNLS